MSRFHYSHFLLASLAMLWVNAAHGQFTYFAAGASISEQKFTSDYKYSLYDIDIEYAHNQTYRITTSSLHLGVFWRPLKVVGVGLQAGAPVSQPSKGNVMAGFTHLYGRWGFKESSYNLASGISARMNIRFFIGRSGIFYGDASIGLGTLTERFTLRRPFVEEYRIASTVLYPALEAINIDDTRSYSIATPGLQLGAMPHVSEHIFIDFHLRMDMLKHPKSSLRYDIESGWDSTNQVPVVNTAMSPFDGSTYWVWTLGFSAGYFF